jgi:hypothetical protein
MVGDCAGVGRGVGLGVGRREGKLVVGELVGCTEKINRVGVGAPPGLLRTQVRAPLNIRLPAVHAFRRGCGYACTCRVGSRVGVGDGGRGGGSSAQGGAGSLVSCTRPRTSDRADLLRPLLLPFARELLSPTRTQNPLHKRREHAHANPQRRLTERESSAAPLSCSHCGPRGSAPAAA